MPDRRLVLGLVVALLMHQGSARSSPPPSSSGGGKAGDAKAKEAPAPPATKDHPVPMQIRQGLSKQVQASLEKYGESITIMVVGETGVGKTTLLSNLLQIASQLMMVLLKGIGANLANISGVPFQVGCPPLKL